MTTPGPAPWHFSALLYTLPGLPLLDALPCPEVDGLGSHYGVPSLGPGRLHQPHLPLALSLFRMFTNMYRAPTQFKGH